MKRALLWACLLLSLFFPALSKADAFVDPSYAATLSAWLQSHKQYPSSARQRGEEGVVTLRTVIGRDGSILEYQLKKRSGWPELDASVEKMMSGSKFPPFPGSMPDPEIEVSVNIRFELTRGSSSNLPMASAQGPTGPGPVHSNRVHKAIAAAASASSSPEKIKTASTVDIVLPFEFKLKYIGSDSPTGAQFWAATKVNEICYTQRGMGGFNLQQGMVSDGKNLTTVITTQDNKPFLSNEITQNLMRAATALHGGKCPGPKTGLWKVWMVPLPDVERLDPINGRLASMASAQLYPNGALELFGNSIFDQHQNELRAEAAAREAKMREENNRREREIAAEKANAEAQAKQERRSTFFQKIDNKQLVDIEELQRNPFPYKGKSVAVFAAFGRMVSEGSAVFTFTGASPVPALIINGVPPTMFRDNSIIILALKVVGLKDGMVEGSYVDTYWCQKQNCVDFR